MILLRAAAALCAAALLTYMTTAATNSIAISKEPLLTNTVSNLDQMLEPVRAEYKLPGLVAAVCSDKELLAAGAVGLRKVGSSEPIELTDKFHLGSCTKSMTALLAALMIERGQFKWNSTVLDLFPDRHLARNVGEITLEQLLTHRSGMRSSVSGELWEKAFSQFRGNGQQQRDDFFKEALQEKLQRKPGKKFIYSNTGYAVLGGMIERRAGKSWEDLVRAEIYQPLQMESGGFGPPGFPNKVDQPWGHTFAKGEPKPQDPSDNPLAIAPAGAAHCSITDFARYASFHLVAAQGKVPWLSQAAQRKLYTPPPGGFFSSQDYAGGWVVVDRQWAGGKALTHAGSNTMFYAVVWIAPQRNMAFVVCTNAGSSDGGGPPARAADQVVSRLIARYLPMNP